MPKVKIILTKIEEMRRIEKVKYLMRVNVPHKIKHIENYLKKAIKENDNLNIVDREVLSADILDGDMIDEKTVSFVINPVETKITRRNKITYL